MKLLFLTVLVLSCFIADARAQQPIDIKDTVQDKTFWHTRFPERYYFGADGAFLMQYTSARESHEAGSVREGTWSVGESNRLCWTFTDEGIERCYDISEDLLAKRPWYSFDNVYELKEAGRPSNILWNRWTHGNLITKPDVYQAISGGKTPPLDDAAYKAAITGKVMRLPLDYVYHRADSLAFWVDEKMANKIVKTPDIADKGAKNGIDVWDVKDGRHCYLTPTQDQVHQSCMTVFSAQDLYIPQEGWVQIMDDNFIRLIKPADLIAVR